MNRPNVLFIVMDTARAQSVLPSENPGVMTNLRSIGEEGAIFRNAVTTAPWTLPSHASMFTGQYTSDHQTHAGSVGFNPDVTPLAKRLRREGYQTMAVSNNTWISPVFGFDDGFDRFYQGWEVVKGGVDLSDVVRENDLRTDQLRAILNDLSVRNLPATVINTVYSRFLHRRVDYGAGLTNRRVRRLLSRTWDRSQPFFLFINYLEPHLSYDPPKSYRYEFLRDGLTKSDLDTVNQDQWAFLRGDVPMNEDDFRALESLYEGELRYLDHRLGRLFEFLSEEGILDETLIIVTGDHGENIGDHGLMDHQYCLYDTLLRVPLILRLPGRIPAGVTSGHQVELRDLYPTVLDACDIPLPSGDGMSESSLLDYSPGVESSSDSSENVAFAEYVVPQPDIDELRSQAETPQTLDQLESFDRSLRCVRTGDWKYIRGSDGSAELFDLGSDPAESTNLVNDRPDVARKLDERLDSEFDPLATLTNSLSEVEESARRNLEDLGYI